MRKTMIFASGAAAFMALQAGPVLAGTCRDPWITQAITEVTGRPPTGAGESGDCTYTQYGGGHWWSYPELKGYVQQKLKPAGLPTANLGGNSFAQPGQVKISASQVQQYRTLNGVQQFLYNGKWYNILSNANGALIGNDTAGAVPTNAGNFISTNGATMAPR